jgi:NTP pyrophosphatase (non-canonical NTP hydrolase)
MTSKLHLRPNPTLRDIQEYVAALEKERGFTHQSILEVWVLVTEEIGELAKCVRKSATSMGTDSAKQYSFDAAGELADLIIVLSAIANRLGVDLEQAFRDKEEVNKQRTWA